MAIDKRIERQKTVRMSENWHLSVWKFQVRTMVHLCVTEDIIKPFDLWAVRWLTEDDAEAFAEPLLKTVDRGWTLKEFRDLQDSGYSYCGILLDGKLCSMAGVWRRFPDIWEVIAVGTREEYRRRGMASSVVCFATEYILQHVKAASYGSREGNIASIRTALGVGFRYCTNVFNGDPWCANDPRPQIKGLQCPLIGSV